MFFQYSPCFKNTAFSTPLRRGGFLGDLHFIYHSNSKEKFDFETKNRQTILIFDLPVFSIVLWFIFELRLRKSIQWLGTRRAAAGERGDLPWLRRISFACRSQVRSFKRVLWETPLPQNYPPESFGVANPPGAPFLMNCALRAPELTLRVVNCRASAA